ncbi:uncharacterized protein A1O9_01790 [Exophiala aquamarina CBS 119918]|uniref:DUF7729 domain-containing protein n=1 Tax=Exophiala aquamarina CBS 119918 TaxID=1182545 RepID=A0A072PVS3_9EURO|nr:uncharacterized protein A1O9_01790 [Exophiala aquamarina CBS 119918]KEF63812.1 hypothetical protein A1O9_01790 [Exophiala aquamarina CBS 119918]
MVSTTAGYAINFNPNAYESMLLRELAAKGEIHVDRRQPPPRPSLIFQRREEGDEAASTATTESEAEPTAASSEESAASTTETTSSAKPTTTKASTTEANASVVPSTTKSGTTLPSVTVVTTSLPSAFDTSLGSNFTKPSCPQFFSKFLGNSTYQSCLPISLFLQNSNSFFSIQRSATLLAQTLDAACEAPLAICMPLLSNLAAELIDDDNCGADFSRENPLVLQAYSGLVAYEPVYRATCLKNAETGTYCFSDAVLNQTNPVDFYTYYTAIGMTMPPAVHPTCNQCLHDTMEIFASYAGTDNQPLAKTYLSCANQIDATCGVGFVATNIKTGTVAAPGEKSAASLPRMSVMTTGLAAMIAALLIVL